MDGNRGLAAALLVGAALTLGACTGGAPESAPAAPNIAMYGQAVRSGVAVSIDSGATPRVATGTQLTDPAVAAVGTRSTITVDLASGEHCVGTSRLQGPLDSGDATGPLLLRCNDGVLWEGSYITFDVGTGLARLHGSNGADARVVYGGDVPEGFMDQATFEALWDARPETVEP
jgi:hypothetical protein